MIDQRKICQVFIREILRLSLWLAKYDNIDFTRGYAACAMAELFRQAAYGQETPAGPFQRLYWLAWQSMTRDRLGQPSPRWEDVYYQLPDPSEDDLAELCEAYAEVARLSLESETSTDEIADVVKAISMYTFTPDDVFSLIYEVEGVSRTAMIIGNAIACADAKPWARQSYRSFGASLWDTEKEKSENWLHAHVL